MKKWTQASRLLRQAADPTRLQILLVLAEEQVHCEMLVASLGKTPSVVARHLALLRHGGLVTTHRRGGVNFYELTTVGRALARSVCSLLAPSPFPVQDSSHPRRPTSVDQMVAMPDADWLPLNNRRGDLIHRKNRQGLDPEEMREFDLLQEASLRRMQRDFPSDDPFEDRLRDLETMLLGVGRVEK